MISRQPFWYLRHGQTDWNAQNLSQGRTDIPLNSVGRQQAFKAAKTLVECWKQGQEPISHIVSSPLSRAHNTAAEVQRQLKETCKVHLSLTIDEGLQEVCFGVQEGKPMGDWYDDWIAGEGTPQGCEPFAALKQRAADAINRAFTPKGLPLIVAHGALFRAVRACMELPINVRLANAVPIYCTPESESSMGWHLKPYE